MFNEIINEDNAFDNDNNAVNNLLNYLARQLNLSQQFFDTIRPMLVKETLNHKLQVARQGEICEQAFWINSGYGRLYSYQPDKEGLLMDVTIDFFKPGSILVVPESFFAKRASEFYVELAKGAVVVPITKSCFDAIRLISTEIETLANTILSLERPDSLRKKELMKLKPRLRYREFLNIFGSKTEHFIAIKHIASYLGMQPCYLSRLRSEIGKKPVV